MKPLAVLLGLILLGGCNAEERSHVVKLEKGGYTGTADGVLSDATRLTLRQRMAWLTDGPAEVAAGDGPAPTATATVSGRITGQNY